jgi:hypothetical protein
MGQHLVDLLQPWQIKNLYNLTNEQLRKPPEHLSSATKMLEDYKSHLGTFILNINIFHCRPTTQTCGSK